MDLLEQKGVQNLNSCLLESLISGRSTACTCGGPRQYSREFSSFIIIDLHIFDRIEEISLKDIPPTLNILCIHFAKSACIEYLGDNNKKNVGHYVSHIYRCNRWERYDDMRTNITSSNVNSKIKGQVLFYVKTKGV